MCNGLVELKLKKLNGNVDVISLHVLCVCLSVCVGGWVGGESSKSCVIFIFSPVEVYASTPDFFVVNKINAVGVDPLQSELPCLWGDWIKRFWISEVCIFIEHSFYFLCKIFLNSEGLL